MVNRSMGDIELQNGQKALLRFPTESDNLRKELRKSDKEKTRLSVMAFIFLLLFVAFFIFAGETSDIFHDGPEEKHRRNKVQHSEVCGAYIHFPGSDYETFKLCPFVAAEPRTLTCGEGDSLIILGVGLDGSGVSNAVGKLYQFCKDNWVDNSCSFTFWDDIVATAPPEERRMLGKGEHAMDNFMTTVSYMCRFHVDGEDDASEEESTESNPHHNGNGGHNNHHNYDYGYYDDYYNEINDGPQTYDNPRRPNRPNRPGNGKGPGNNADNSYQRGPDQFDLNHGAHNNEHGAGHGANQQNQGNNQQTSSNFNGQPQQSVNDQAQPFNGQGQPTNSFNNQGFQGQGQPNFNGQINQNAQGFNGQGQPNFNGQINQNAQGFNGQQQNQNFQGQNNYNGQGQNFNGFNGQSQSVNNPPIVNPNYQPGAQNTAIPFTWQNGQLVPTNTQPPAVVIPTLPAAVVPTSPTVATQPAAPVITPPKVLASKPSPAPTTTTTTTAVPTTTQDLSEPMYWINGQPVYYNSADSIDATGGDPAVDFHFRATGYDGWHGHKTYSAPVDCAGAEGEGGESAGYDGFHHHHGHTTMDPCANAEPAGAEAEGGAEAEAGGAEAEGGEPTGAEGATGAEAGGADEGEADEEWAPSEGDAFHQNGNGRNNYNGQLGCGGFLHYPLTDYETFKQCPFDPMMPQTIDCGSKSTIHILNVEWEKTDKQNSDFEVTNGITLLYDFCKTTWTSRSTECTFTWWGDIVPEQELEEDVVPPKLSLEYLCFHEKKKRQPKPPAKVAVAQPVVKPELKRKTHGCGKCEEIGEYSYCRSCVFDSAEKRELSCSEPQSHVLPIHLRVHGTTQPAEQLVSIHDICRASTKQKCAFAYKEISDSKSQGELPISDEQHAQHIRNFPYATNAKDFARWGVILDYVCMIN